MGHEKKVSKGKILLIDNVFARYQTQTPGFRKMIQRGGNLWCTPDYLTTVNNFEILLKLLSGSLRL